MKQSRMEVSLRKGRNPAHTGRRLPASAATFAVEVKRRTPASEAVILAAATGRTLALAALLLILVNVPASGMELIRTIRGDIAPKSIGYSGAGLFFAQNMMYRHSVTVYDREFRLLKTIPDRVELSRFIPGNFRGWYRGAPVEVAFTDSGRTAWVSNYLISGAGFVNPGNDSTATGRFDNSVVYRIDARALEVTGAVPAGSVPKYLASTPDGRLVLVSNWCSGDLSVIDCAAMREMKRVRLGRYPRGIAVDRSSARAYVAVMGSYDVAVLDLKSFALSWLRGIGRSPRTVLIDSAGRYLYATLNGEGSVAKVDVGAGRLVRKAATGSAPRSMAITPDGSALYVTNYASDTMSKITTADMRVVATVPTQHHPIGITFDPVTRRVWVACYSGSIMVFQD